MSQYTKWPVVSGGGGGSGTVTSVGLIAPSALLTVSGSPVTTSGNITLTLGTRAANLIFAGPTTGAAATPTFRSLVAADLSGLAIASINADTTSAQVIAAATTGMDFTVTTSAGTTTLALPSASATARGLITTGAQTIAGAKTFSSVVAVPSGAVGAPAINFGSATTGVWSPTSTTLALAIAGAETVRWDASGILVGTTANTDSAKLTIKNVGADTQTALQLVSNTNVKVGIAVIGGILDFSDGAVPFFGYDVVNTLMSLGYNAGAPKFRLSMDSSSASTNPTGIVSSGSSVLPPMLVCRNTNGTAGNYGGIANVGTSNIVNGWFAIYNDTHTSSSEDSHVGIATCAAGVRSEKLVISKLGQVAIQAAGTGLSIKTGSNCKMGTAVLVGGTAVVANTSVTASSIIFLTIQVAGGVLGVTSVGTVVPATSFVINSSNVADTSTVGYMIVEPS